jgi:hypothetical protein
MLGIVGAVMAIPIAASVRVVMSPMVATMHDPAPTDRPDS